MDVHFAVCSHRTLRLSRSGIIGTFTSIAARGERRGAYVHPRSPAVNSQSHEFQTDQYGKAAIVDSAYAKRVSPGSRITSRAQLFTFEGTKMDDKYANAREHFFAAIRTLAASADTIQTRLIDANVNILHVTIDEFAGDRELKFKLAKILDLLAIDQDDMEAVAV
ncbi:hypothetical protein [Mesorhizobium sp. INR15]|uniref:hypothetical protein n=1 Tax=Mesorhizobium sp. INR15 TaxID=2654248 RepID=UPI002156666E|nr:hypothetical protein [Mesorhizobium sp. INR15]